MHLVCIPDLTGQNIDENGIVYKPQHIPAYPTAIQINNCTKRNGNDIY